jgi:hypothetical protein
MTRPTVPTSRRPHPDAAPAPDVHAYVLARLDAHLDELYRLREELASSRPRHPGARWQAAAATATGARRYAADIARALNTCAGMAEPETPVA